MWIGLFPEFSDVGGIQQVSRHTAAVLVEKAHEQKLDCELLGLNDPAVAGSFWVGRNNYGFRGFARGKLALLLHLLRRLPRLEVLYLGHANLAPLGLFLRLVSPGVEYWVVLHGVEVWYPLPSLRRLALRCAGRVLSVSSFTAHHAVHAQKLNPRRVFILSPALDPSFLDAASDRPPAPLLPDGQILLTVGRLISAEPGKGVDSVIRVLPDVLKLIPNIYYVVVGGGDLLQHLEQQAWASPARDRILFLGKLKLEQLKSLYARADIFVMPSRQEGFGLTFLEAMALGKPVVAGNYGGTPEVVQDEVTGFLVDPGDLQGLAGRLVQLLQDEALRRKLGEAGRQRVEEYYTFKDFQERLARILDTGV
jgi:phosphatidyl-myo-inositol dimannoside synthase